MKRILNIWLIVYSLFLYFAGANQFSWFEYSILFVIWLCLVGCYQNFIEELESQEVLHQLRLENKALKEGNEETQKTLKILEKSQNLMWLRLRTLKQLNKEDI